MNGLLDLDGQFVDGKGFLNKMHARIQNPVVGDDIGRIAGYEEALEARTISPSRRANCQLFISDINIIDGSAMAGGQGDGILRSAGRQDMIAQCFEH